MTPEQLDAFLRKVTPHEEDYRNGKISELIQTSPRKIIDGQEVMYINVSENLRDKPVPHIGFYTCKHSRFQFFPLHYQECLEIDYMYSGSCHQSIHGKDYSLSEGQVIFIDSDVVHSISPLGERDIMIRIYIEKPFLRSGFLGRLHSNSLVLRFLMDSIMDATRSDNYLIFHSEKNRRLRWYITELMCERYDPSPNSADVCLNMLAMFLSELVNVFEMDIYRSDVYSQTVSVIPIIRYIEANYKVCTLKDIAEHFNLDADYVSAILKRQTGYSFRTILLNRRMCIAKQLLFSSSMSIVDVAQAVGYENITFFYQKFQEYCGMTPGEYRIQNG